jgi:hypothetical protein
VVDEHTWEAVHNLITQPARRKNLTPGRNYLLTGIAVCGVRDTDISSGNDGVRRPRPVPDVIAW